MVMIILENFDRSKRYINLKNFEKNLNHFSKISEKL